MNDAEKLENLWHEYRLSVARYIGRRIHDAYLIEELTAVTYARAWVAMTNGNGYHAEALAWLYTIAKSVLRDFWRNWHNRTWHVEIDAQPEERDESGTRPTADLLVVDEQIEERCIIRVELPNAMRRLTEQQAVVVGYRMQGYQYNEIGEMIGNSFEGTKQLMRRAEANLREFFQEAA